MTEGKRLLAGFSMLCSDMVALSMAWFLFFGRKNALPPLPYPLWGALAALSLLFNTRMKRKEGRVNLTMVFSSLLGVVTGALLLRLTYRAELSLGALAFVFFMGFAVVLHAALLAHDTWQYNQQVLYLDGMVVCAALLLLVRNGENWERLAPCFRWALLSMALCVLTLTAYRTQEAGRSLLWLTAGCALLAALSWLAGERLHGVVGAIAAAARRLLRVIGSFLALIGRALAAFLRWFLSLFPAQDGPVPVLELPEDAAAMPEVLPDTGGAMSRILIGLGILTAALALWWLLRKFRGRRWKRGKFHAEELARAERRRSRGRIRDGWRALWRRLLFFLNSLRYRNTPEGLLTCAERAFQKTRLKRRANESAPGFLRRLQGERPGSRYGELADCLERLYYRGGQEALPTKFAGEFRRQLRRDSADAADPGAM